MNAEAVQMMKVSRNTPNACTQDPCSTGWLTAAVAAALGHRTFTSFVGE